MNQYRRFICISLALFASGCATNTDRYHWGSYENLIYQSYVEPGAVDPQSQILALQTDIAEAESQGKPVPPGLHIHLGYMHYQNGDSDKAFQAFNREIILYPESELFINGLLMRAEGS